MAVLGVVESHAAVVVAELRCNQSHVGGASPRLGHVLLYTNQLLFRLRDVVKIITYSGCGQSVAGCQGGTGRVGTGTRRAVENGLIVFASGAG